MNSVDWQQQKNDTESNRCLYWNWTTKALMSDSILSLFFSPKKREFGWNNRFDYAFWLKTRKISLYVFFCGLSDTDEWFCFAFFSRLFLFLTKLSIVAISCDLSISIAIFDLSTFVVTFWFWIQLEFFFVSAFESKIGGSSDIQLNVGRQCTLHIYDGTKRGWKNATSSDIPFGSSQLSIIVLLLNRQMFYTHSLAYVP